MSLESDYQKTHAEYKKLAADPSKRAEKLKPAADCQRMEIELSNQGTIAEAGVIVSRGGETLRSQQGEDCRKVGGEKALQVNGKKTTKREDHQQRPPGG